MVVARLQNGGGDLAAALVVEDAVVTGAKLSAVPFLGGLDVAGAARRRARPVGVPLLYDSAGLDQGRPRLKRTCACCGKTLESWERLQSFPATSASPLSLGQA